ncbi:hypothetical protein [Desulfogranum japonicum]|uniref:hypothetical protein n=1 Tax=Desulfogranum japonicum TaxID=231447 RepID=UPI001294818E|nr:hypothetical protein [Desulfogranum japonicum]
MLLHQWKAISQKITSLSNSQNLSGNPHVNFLIISDLGEPFEIRQERKKSKGFVANNRDIGRHSTFQMDF